MGRGKGGITCFLQDESKTCGGEMDGRVHLASLFLGPANGGSRAKVALQPPSKAWRQRSGTARPG